MPGQTARQYNKPVLPVLLLGCIRVPVSDTCAAFTMKPALPVLLRKPVILVLLTNYARQPGLNWVGLPSVEAVWLAGGHLHGCRRPAAA